MMIQRKTDKGSAYSDRARAASSKPLLLALFLAMLAASSCSSPTQPSRYGAGEDYRIYSIVLKEDPVSSGATIVLWDTTQTTVLGSDSGRVARLKENLPGLQDETLTEFMTANKNPAKLMQIAGIDNLVLSSQYENRSDTQTVRVSLSRVGYNTTRTQAVVEVGVLLAPLVGSGTLVFLTKENGVWKVTGRCMTWIS